MALPKTIRVGGILYSCKHQKDLAAKYSRAVGHCDYTAAEITIAPGHNKRAEAATVLHEIVHATFYCCGESGLAGNEDVVERVAQSLLGTLLDSDDLLIYLDEVR